MNTVDLNILDFSNSPLATSPLVRPLKQLAKELTALVEVGSLLGVELDLTHAETPCFLLNVAPSAPKFYVELFVGEPFFDEMFEEEENDEESMPLNVLMNWTNSDTEPTFWQTGFHPSETTSLNNASSDVDFTEVIDFSEVIDHILLLTEALPEIEALPETEA